MAERKNSDNDIGWTNVTMLLGFGLALSLGMNLWLMSIYNQTNAKVSVPAISSSVNQSLPDGDYLILGRSASSLIGTTEGEEDGERTGDVLILVSRNGGAMAAIQRPAGTDMPQDIYSSNDYFLRVGSGVWSFVETDSHKAMKEMIMEQKKNRR